MRIFIYLTLFCCYSCAPTLMEMQSARTLSKNKIELSPSYSNALLSRNTNSTFLQNQFGLGLGYGISNRFDVKLRYEWINTSSTSFNNASVFGLEGKYNIIKDKVSFSTSVGRGIGQNLENSWQIHPKLIFSYPIIYNRLEFNLIPKYIITFSDKYSNLLSTNIGLAYSRDDLSKWAIRLEYGILADPQNREGFINSFGLGFNYTL